MWFFLQKLRFFSQNSAIGARKSASGKLLNNLDKNLGMISVVTCFYHERKSFCVLAHSSEINWCRNRNKYFNFPKCHWKLLKLAHNNIILKFYNLIRISTKLHQFTFSMGTLGKTYFCFSHFNILTGHQIFLSNKNVTKMMC